jgi:hypothetical protein
MLKRSTGSRREREPSKEIRTHTKINIHKKNPDFFKLVLQECLLPHPVC